MSSVVLCILDGVGWGKRDDGDAVYSARTPVLDRLQQDYPWILLKAHGTAVGMPSDGDMGNSEVGHNAMGAGRIFAQGAKLVQQSFESGSIWKSSVWGEIQSRSCLHLMGLVSDGNVHSHIDHLLAFIRQAKADGIERVWVHMLTDGRDVDPRSALQYLARLQPVLDDCGPNYRVATGGGRMWITMDRYEADWEMVKRGYDCHVLARGPGFESAKEAIEHFYAADPKVDDQWLPSFVVNGYEGMSDGDAVIFFNFRGDRAIEISRALEEPDFPHFVRERHPKVYFSGMMEYDGDRHIPTNYLVDPPQIDDTVGERMSAAKQRVLSISETQKFGHVTYFFNGNKSEALAYEDQVEIPSYNVPFDQRPEMSAKEITQKVCEAMTVDKYDLIRLNIANGDMVGHSGNFSATVSAMETVDFCLEKLYQTAIATNSILLVTADHGNADEMFQYDSKKGRYKTQKGQRVISTSHSKNPVPFILIDPQKQWELSAERESIGGGIAQIGGTLLSLTHLPVPPHYLPSLVQKQST